MPRWLTRVRDWFQVDALVLAQKDRLQAELKAADYRRRLEVRIWLDLQGQKQRAELERQVSHWCQRTIHEEGVTRQALEDRDEAIQSVLRLEGEVKELERRNDELIEIADKQMKKARR